jgi:hypothetical protein
VVVDLKSFRAVPVPDWLRLRFEAAMEPKPASRRGDPATSGGRRDGPA